MSDQQPVAAKPLPKRPLAVWILTILDGLLGAYLVTVFFRLSSNPYSGVMRFYQSTEYSLLPVLYWGAMGLAICVTANLAWAGGRRARNLLLGLLTVYLGLGVIQSLIYLAWASTAPFLLEGFIGWQIAGAAGSLLWLAANYWFLLGARTRGFFAA